MNPTEQKNHHWVPPPASRTFKLPKAAFSLILAAALLVGLLITTSIENIHRAQTLMEDFLIQKGETVIRSVEAGNRMSMRHFMARGENILAGLLAENIHDEDILYIRILDMEGKIIVQAGDTPEQPLTETVQQVLANKKRATHLNKGEKSFELTDIFKPGRAYHMGRRMQSFNHHGSRAGQGQRPDFHPDRPQIISVGLLTTKFDAARTSDVHHAMLMAAILFLVGSAGLYFMFLYQSIRITKAKLSHMQIYTDNVIESIPAGLVTLDSRDNIASFNRKAEELFSCSPDQAKGKPMAEALQGYPKEFFQSDTPQADLSVECMDGKGRSIPVTISSSQLLDQDGSRMGTVLIIRDMSLIKDMEQQLERSRRMAALGKMAAGIAHEIRNPLGTLRGFAQFFGAGAEEGTETKKYADVMVSEVDRLNQNISGLLQFARPREPHFAQVFLDELIAKTVTLMADDFSNHQILFTQPKTSDIALACDPDLILQVLLNLLKNSIQATPAGGRISLGIERDDATVRLTISDTGKGMSEEEREKMFDPFFTTKKNGTGLGLAVSHQIIEQHRGSFEVETEPGKGTTICIVLPQSQNNT